MQLPGTQCMSHPGGRLRIPADLLRMRQTIRLLPKSSPKFLSHAQLRVLVERAASQSGSESFQSKSTERPDPDRHLKEWADHYGFSVGDVRAELKRWAAEIASSKETNSYDLSLAAFATHNFSAAADRAMNAASEEEANLSILQQTAAGGHASSHSRLSPGRRRGRQWLRFRKGGERLSQGPHPHSSGSRPSDLV